MDNFDIIIIGGGPAGYAGAIKAAQLKAKVCLVEQEDLGGTCLNRGCIPTKALIASARIFNKIKKASEFGIDVNQISLDFSRVMFRKDEIVNRLKEGIAQLLKGNKIEVKKGKGVIKDQKIVKILYKEGQEEIIQADKIIIATGSKPSKPSAFNIDGLKVLTSDEILELSDIPESLLIIGGGYIGCEFAYIFSEFGSKITIVELLPRILSMEDRQIASTVERAFKKNGVKIYTGTSVEDIKTEGVKVVSKLTSGEEIITDKVLLSTGRTINSKGIGLENIGIKMDGDRVIVNEKMETNIPGIYAVGDVVGGAMLAHVASSEAIVAAHNAMGNEMKMDYSAIPNTVFTYPEIASVGLTEQKAKENGYDVKVGRFYFIANGKALCLGETEGFIKIVVDLKNEKIIGSQIVGPHATDLITELTLSIQNGLTFKEIIKTIHAHPTLAEVIFEAAEDVDGKAIHKLRVR